MGLDVFDVIVLTIHANDDENAIKGRTTIQKLIYFNTLNIRELDISNYEHYFYGPFSRKVAVALDDLVGFSFVDQNVMPGLYRTNNYRLTKSGIKYAKTTKEEYPDEFEKIRETLKICKEHCKLRQSPLSYAAKAHYSLAGSDRDQRRYTEEEVRDIAQNFDWNISANDAKTGMAVLQDLGLVMKT